MESAISADLHPLALEDVLHQRGHARSKADYYPQHLFIRVLIHTLATDDDAASSISHLPRSESPTNIGDDDDDDDDSEYQFGKKPYVDGLPIEEDDEKTVYGSANPSRFSTMKHGTSVRRRFGRSERADVENSGPIQKRFAGVEEDQKAQKNARNRKLLRELKRGDRVNVKIQPLCLFLFRDGTVISIHKGEWARRIHCIRRLED